MKKKSIIIVGLLAVVAVLCVAYRLMNHAPSTDLPAEQQVLAILDDGGCLSCHSAQPDLPFYASWPVVGSTVKSDAETGYKVFDIAPLYAALAGGQPLSEVDMAKVEKVALDGSMPPAKYYLVHWGSSLISAKQDMVLAWAKTQRQALMAAAGVAPEFCNEPVRPVPDSIPVDLRKVVLGNILYHDARLSLDNTVSCATCHGLNTGGVDNKQYSEGVGGQFGGVNAPTTFNAVCNFVQFWDGRAATLADQAAGPPLNPVEMASESFDQIIAKLAEDKDFVAAFTEVYPDGLTQANITNAIQEFETTLLTPGSRFDQYLRGAQDVLTADEISGYELFKKYDCATCHVGEILGGKSYELLGIKADYFADRPAEMTEEDNGRFKQTAVERDRHRFKVPGLRNVELTYPYFHDGTINTLEEAVAAMAKYEVGVDLSKQETDQIVAFLRTLTGQYQGQQLTNANQK